MAAAFRLARMLRLRTQLRERARDEVTRTRTMLTDVREELAAVRANQDAARAAEEATARVGITGSDLMSSRRFERASRARGHALEREGVRLAEELVRCCETLLDRRREERQLERLRERQRERSLAVEERATMVLLDDLVVRRRQGGR